jgi:hypothetical protein
MKRFNLVCVAAFALGATTWAQEPQEERVEVKVIAPDAEAGEAVIVDTIDPEGWDLGTLGSFILGVDGQDSGEKGEGKAKRQDDGTIVREIDLGGGRKLKIIVTTEDGKPAKAGAMAIPQRRRFAVAEPPKHGLHGVTVFGPEGLKGFDPHGFDLKVKELGDEVRSEMDRALRAFERAREEFIRAYKADAPEGKADRPERKILRRAPAARDDHDDDDVKVKVGAEHKARARAEAEAEHKAKVEAIQNKIEDEIKAKVERDHVKVKRPEVQFLDVTPGAASKQSREIEKLREEIKELEKMVRALKDEMKKKSE